MQLTNKQKNTKKLNNDQVKVCYSDVSAIQMFAMALF